MLKLLTVLTFVLFPAFAHADNTWSFFNKRDDKPSYSVRVAGAVVARGVNAVDIAMRHIGKNPTGMSRLWCARYVGMVERKAGRKGTGSDMARSYAKYGKAVKGLKHIKKGDIVVLSRGKRGGHVGYATGKVVKGKVQLVSGNSGGKPGRRAVTVSHYSAAKIIAIRRPA